MAGGAGDLDRRYDYDAGVIRDVIIGPQGVVVADGDAFQSPLLGLL
jgi:hypothetical protein